MLINSIAQTSEFNIVGWGCSARANGKHDGTYFHQEDKFAYAEPDKGAFFGVYDGHGDATDNNQACNILKDKFHLFFEQAQGSEETRMLEASRQIEALALEYNPKLGGFNVTGSTAAIAYIKNGAAHIAHAGDSRIILFGKHDNNIHFATQDHDFENQAEFARVKQVKGDEFDKHYSTHNRLGQCEPRLNGLPMTRAFGNARAKRIFNKGDVGDGAIIATPEYNDLPLTDNSTFLVMATDGLWDVMKNEEVAAFVNKLMNESIETLKQRYTDRPLTINKHANIAVRNAVGRCMTPPMTEDDFKKTNNFKNKSWDIIAQENNISVNNIRLILNMTEEQFELAYPQNENHAFGRTPMHYDFVEEERGDNTMHDEKCMLIARALRDHAVELGSRDNMLVTVIDLYHPLTLQEKLKSWWYFMSTTKKNIIIGSFIAAIIGMLYCKLIR
jgi:serine/threonine protein phosphatase PrpC